MNNEPLKQIASKVLNLIPIDEEDQEKFGSVLIILAIISIILTLVRVIQECDKSKIKLLNRQNKYEHFSQQIRNMSIRRSWFTKMTIKKILRKEFDRNDYYKYGMVITNAILDVGENLSQNEIKILVEEANV
jgi:hypothetical protein